MKRRTTIYIRDKVWDKVRYHAARECRSASAQAEIWLREIVNQLEKQNERLPK